jgi:hypothetical protein
VINKPCGRGGHSPRWVAEPEKIIIIIIIINFIDAFSARGIGFLRL